MIIEIQSTPNPNTKMFFPPKKLVDSLIEINSLEEAKGFAIAVELMKIIGVVKLMFTASFISISKNDNTEWDHIKLDILAIIEDYCNKDGSEENNNIQEDDTPSINLDDYDEDERGIIKTIEEILEDNVRPAVQNDGGDVRLVKFDNGIVYLKLRGACSGCPSASVTLKEGIENMLCYYVPGVSEVKNIDDEV